MTEGAAPVEAPLREAQQALSPHPGVAHAAFHDAECQGAEGVLERTRGDVTFTAVQCRFQRAIEGR